MYRASSGRCIILCIPYKPACMHVQLLYMPHRLTFQYAERFTVHLYAHIKWIRHIYRFTPAVTVFIINPCERACTQLSAPAFFQSSSVSHISVSDQILTAKKFYIFFFKSVIPYYPFHLFLLYHKKRISSNFRKSWNSVPHPGAKAYLDISPPS